MLFHNSFHWSFLDNRNNFNFGFGVIIFETVLMSFKKKLSMRKLDPDKFGYYGKSISSMSKEELLKALTELIERVRKCPHKDKKCIVESEFERKP